MLFGRFVVIDGYRWLGRSSFGKQTPLVMEIRTIGSYEKSAIDGIWQEFDQTFLALLALALVPSPMRMIYQRSCRDGMRVD